MKPLFESIMPRIWTRFFVLVLAAVALTWIVVGFSVQALLYASGVVTELETDQVPTLTRTSRLSVRVADLAVLSNELLFADSLSDSPLGDAADELGLFLADDLGEGALQQEARGILDSLDLLTRKLMRIQQIEDEIAAAVTRLRWLYVDIQDETAAVAADFNFNIQAQTRALVGDSDPAAREGRAALLLDEMRLRDAFADLAAASATAFSVAVQSSNTRSPEQLDQLTAIEEDAFARLQELLQHLPEKSEYLTLRQSVAALDALINGRDGLIAGRRDWHALRDGMHDQLDNVLARLTELQQGLQRDAEAQRLRLTRDTAAFSDRIRRTMALLVAATMLALTGGVAILFFYIRPVIIRPMQRLTSAMHTIASGGSVDMATGTGRNDEIGQLSRAVAAFGASVNERDRAITELKQTQNELVQAGKMAALGNLSAGIGHELNQPLGALGQRLHLVRAAIGSGDTAAQHRQVDKIEDLVDRMERIIAHLKRFARRSEYLREEVELVPLIRAAGELTKASFTDRSIALSIDPELAGAVFLGDPVLVEQVVLNLLSNASDAIADTGGGGTVDVCRETADPGFVAFSVVDSGPGFGDLDPRRAFDPFVTTKDPGKGMGLGLSISYNIVRGLGGNLTLSVRRDTGVRATVTLPAREGTT